MPYIDKKSAIDALKAIRYGLFEIDIPSPTVPEYVEHHEQIKNMMEITGGWIKKLEEQPTADVVEVVRCKDCKYCDCSIDGMGFFYCDFDEGRTVSPNGFCDVAERRKEREDAEIR